MHEHPRILIVEPDPIASQALAEQVHALGYVTAVARSDNDAIEQLEQDRARSGSTSIGVVIADQNARGMGQNIELIQRLHRDWPAVIAIVTSAFRKVESAVLAMRLGATDYLLKPIAAEELQDAIERAVQRYLLHVERETTQEPVASVINEEDQSLVPSAVTREPQQAWTPMPLAEAMKQPEKQILLAALEANDWNRGQTAQQLDINRTTLYKKIRQYRLDEPA